MTQLGHRTRACAIAALAAAVLVLGASPAQAVLIEYEITDLGSNSYRYEYTVTNDGSLGAGVPIEIFQTHFDPALYDELSLTVVTPTPPANDWTEQILASFLPAFPAAYDATAVGAGVADGLTVAGFAVEFTWLGGPGGPGAQPFEIYSGSFALLESGTTQLLPEPLALTLLAAASLALAVHRRGRF